MPERLEALEDCLAVMQPDRPRVQFERVERLDARIVPLPVRVIGAEHVGAEVLAEFQPGGIEVAGRRARDGRVADRVSGSGSLFRRHDGTTSRDSTNSPSRGCRQVHSLDRHRLKGRSLRLQLAATWLLHRLFGSWESGCELSLEAPDVDAVLADLVVEDALGRAEQARGAGAAAAARLQRVLQQIALERFDALGEGLPRHRV